MSIQDTCILVILVYLGLCVLCFNYSRILYKGWVELRVQRVKNTAKKAVIYFSCVFQTFFLGPYSVLELTWELVDEDVPISIFILGLFLSLSLSLVAIIIAVVTPGIRVVDASLFVFVVTMSVTIFSMAMIYIVAFFNIALGKEDW